MKIDQTEDKVLVEMTSEEAAHLAGLLNEVWVRRDTNPDGYAVAIAFNQFLPKMDW